MERRRIQTLIPYRIGSGPGSEEHLEKGPAQPPAGYSAILVESRQSLFIPDTKNLY